MEGSNCDGNGGWMRIGYINMTEPGATCPQGLYSYTYGGKTLCDKSQGLRNGCSGTFFSAIGLTGQRISVWMIYKLFILEYIINDRTPSIFGHLF
uniref:Uncharacterized protein n=1 Tax=Amphimedon queenslandica TaxID=400682 RepID=A0A1X7SKT8_AMPQE